jgi:hypothetical protein
MPSRRTTTSCRYSLFSMMPFDQRTHIEHDTVSCIFKKLYIHSTTVIQGLSFQFILNWVGSPMGWYLVRRILMRWSEDIIRVKTL